MAEQKNQSLGLTLISPLALPTSDPRNPDYVPSDGDGSSSGPPDISQPEWQKKPEGGFSQWLDDNGKGYSPETLNEYWSKYQSWCKEDGKLEVPITVPKAKEGGEYSIKASYGELSLPTDETTEHTLSEPIKNTDSYKIAADVVGKVTASWEGPVYGPDGSVINAPVITQDGATLSWPTKATGSLRLAYSEEHVKYTLTITPRSNADPNNRKDAYASTVFAVGANGEMSEHAVDLPDMSGNCAQTTLASGKTPGDGSDEKCVRHNILVNPCTKEVIREWDEEIECPEVAKRRKLEECVAACENGPAAAKDACIQKCNEAAK